MQTVNSDSSPKRFGVLSNPNFFKLWAGQSISTFGDTFSDIAIPILVYQVTGSPLQLGLAFAAQMVSGLAFGLVAGAYCDRWDKRKTMSVSNLIRFLLILAIPAVMHLSWGEPARLAAIYGLIFLIASVSQFFVPAKVAAIPAIVSDDELMSANSLDQSAMKIMEFAGYAAAGAFIHFAGTTPAFIVNAATFLVSAALIWSMRLPKGETEGEDAEEPILDSIRAGLAFIRSKPILMGTTILSVIAPLALGATAPLLVVFSDRVIGVGESGYAILETVFALGLGIGVFLIGKYARGVPSGRLLTLGVTAMGMYLLLTFGLPSLLPSASPDTRLVVCLPAFFASAAANGAIFLAIRVIVQEYSPGAMIGRVFSVISVASSVATAAGAGLAGLAEVFDLRLVLLSWSAFLAIVGFVAFRHRVFAPQKGEGSNEEC